MTEKSSTEALISEIKELKAQVYNYQSLVENSPDLFYRTDMNGRITFISPSVFKLSGYTVDEALGMKMAEEVYAYPEERQSFLTQLQQSGAISDFQARLKRKDGSVWWASTNAHFFRDSDGNIIGVEGITRDISELKNAEMKRMEAETRFRLAFQISPDAISLSRLADGIYIDINQRFTDLTGNCRDDVIGKSSFDINLWKEPEDRQKLVDELMTNGFVRNLEAKFVKRNGEVGIGLVSARIFSIGSEDFILSVTRDITEFRAADEALRRTEELHRMFVTQAGAIFWSVDRDLKFTISSGTGLSKIGFTEGQAVGMDLYSFLGNANDEHPAIAAVKKALNGESVTYVDHFANFDWEGRVEPLRDSSGRIIGAVAVSLDITERMKAESALRNSEERLRLITDNMADVITLTDPSMNIVYSSPSVRRVFGYSPETTAGKPTSERIHPDDLGPVMKEAADARQKGEKEIVLRYRWKHANGEYIWAESAARLLYGNQGESKGAILTTRDITERIKAESALRNSEERLRLITENMVDMISLTDAQFRIVYSSPSVEWNFGYSPDELVGKPVSEWVHPDDMENIFTEGAEARAKKESSKMFVYRLRHANGQYLWVESATRFLYTENGEPNGAIYGTRNIDERVRAEEEKKDLEDQLMQAQKIEAIGRLAGGIAHDLNNLLSPILGYCELLLRKGDFDLKNKSKIEMIHKAGTGARDLVQQLLAFSRKQTLEYKPLDMNKVLTGFQKLLRRTIRENIEIKIVRSSEISPVMADAGQIEQVIMNLALNAADAMPEGGTLTIETSPADLDKEYAERKSGVLPGRFVMLAFTDTGHGMDKKTASQIFEPFFTTKGRAGTGLGLATVYGIVKQHQGNIWVYSEPGRGTTIKVYLPVSDEVCVDTPLKDDIVSDDLSGEETILLVEDNPQVLSIVQEILTQYGYNVLVAKSGKEAMNMMSEFGIGIDLLLTDVIMPDMNGKELYSLLAVTHPSLKVLFMSGYTDNVIVHHGVLDEGMHFIQKPFSVTNLVGKLRALLDN